MAYPIGTPGVPWGTQEKAQWLAQQQIKRSYHKDVVTALERIGKARSEHCLITQYGELRYSELSYPLYAVQSKAWQPDLPTMLVTGGVHGYETSGVHGALRFIETALSDYAGRANIIVAPCISPWGYETINRWNPEAVDPNRSFYTDRYSQESKNIMDYVSAIVAERDADIRLHIDLHETTDTDNSEFRPALEARDAKEQEVWDIPDGFYCVGDSLQPAADLQAAIIASVQKVTHIAQADSDDRLIGAKIEQLGVINYPKKELGLCAGFTQAPFVSTTEVYPDSPRVDDENCILAQVAAVCGAIDYVLLLEE